VIREIFKENNGYLLSKEIRGKRNLYYELKQLKDSGVVVQMKRGLYKYPEFATRNHWQEISLMYPDAVIFLFSAFAYYNLSTYIPSVAHLAIKRGGNIKTNRYMPAKIHHLSIEVFNKHISNENDVKIYSIERTVCDAIKYEKQVGTDIMMEVIKNYYKSDKCNLSLLSRISNEIKIEKRTKEIMQLITNI
jgi:predicted transcriptional regulator of viral defense system